MHLSIILLYKIISACLLIVFLLGEIISEGLHIGQEVGRITRNENENRDQFNSVGNDNKNQNIPQHPGREKSYSSPTQKTQNTYTKVPPVNKKQDIKENFNHEMKGSKYSEATDGVGLYKKIERNEEDDVYMNHQNNFQGNNRHNMNNDLEGVRNHYPNHLLNDEFQSMEMSNNRKRRSHHGHSGNKYQHDSMNNHYNTNTTNSYSWLNSLYEIAMTIFLIGFIFNCFFGNNVNDKYAVNWYNSNKQYFEERYEMIGLAKSETLGEDQPKIMNESPLVKENPHIYKLYASNYRYVKWLLVVLEFKKRSDTVSMFTSLFATSSDRVIYQVSINAVDPTGWVFCVCKKRDSKTLRNNYPDVNYFGKSHDPSIFSDRLTVLTESVETFIELFQNKNLLNFYKSVEPFLDLIYYTDQQTFSRENQALIFSFEINLNTNANARKLLEITHFVNLFCDTLAQVNYSEKMRKEFEKNRIMYERAKMEDFKRQEIEDKERKDFIEQWKLKKKMKGKKPSKKPKLDSKKK